MNPLSSLPRFCARRTLAFRPPPSTTPILYTSQRHQSTTAPSSPQPSSDLSPSSPFLLLGTVTRTGTMTQTIQLTTSHQLFDTRLQKHFVKPRRLLAHDPFAVGFLREGDVVEYGPWSPLEEHQREAKRKGLEEKLVQEGKIRLKTRKGKERKLEDVGVKKRGVGWVVRRVVTPFGTGLEERAE